MGVIISVLFIVLCDLSVDLSSDPGISDIISIRQLERSVLDLSMDGIGCCVFLI